jgi:hypothetical protein
MMGRGFGGAGGFGGRMAGGRFGGPGAFFPIGGILIFLVWAALVALLVIVAWRIFHKAGFPGVLGLLMLVPVVNLGAMVYLAFAEWPALKRLAALEAAATPAPVAAPAAVPAPAVPAEAPAADLRAAVDPTGPAGPAV